MSADALRAALESIGVHGRVEARDRLAVLTVPGDEVSVLFDEERRRRAIALARDHGFTNLALELVDSTTRAPLSRD